MLIRKLVMNKKHLIKKLKHKIKNRFLIEILIKCKKIYRIQNNSNNNYNQIQKIKKIKILKFQSQFKILPKKKKVNQQIIKWIIIMKKAKMKKKNMKKNKWVLMQITNK